MSEADDRAVFLASLALRLQKGAEEYGNASFERTFADLTDELLQEYLDIAGWAYIGWAKARARLQQLQAEG